MGSYKMKCNHTFSHKIWTHLHSVVVLQNSGCVAPVYGNTDVFNICWDCECDYLSFGKCVGQLEDEQSSLRGWSYSLSLKLSIKHSYILYKKSNAINILGKFCDYNTLDLALILVLHVSEY